MYNTEKFRSNEGIDIFGFSNGTDIWWHLLSTKNYHITNTWISFSFGWILHGFLCKHPHHHNQPVLGMHYNSLGNQAEPSWMTCLRWGKFQNLCSRELLLAVEKQADMEQK
jgi:hypothetical protein